MKAYLAAFALASAIVVSGCNTEYAEVRFTTDGRGELNSAKILISTGDPDLDRRALRIAKERFRQVVPKPARNAKYAQPVKFHFETPPNTAAPSS